jgi:hypothetical protein
MAVTPTGIISEPINLAKELVAQSATFQSWVNPTTPTLFEAQQHVYAVARSSGGIARYDRPFCLIGLPEGHRWTPGMGEYATGSSFMLIFEADTPAAYRSDDLHQDAAYDFTNKLGGVIEDMINVATSVVDTLFFNTFELAGPIQRSNMADEDEDYFQAMVRIIVGFNGGR